MATKYASVAGAGAKNGNDWANAYDNTQIVGTALPAIGAGGTLIIEADTYNITGGWVLPGAGCTVYAVNKTSHVEDGSRAILNAGSTYNVCINGSTVSGSFIKHIDGTAATFIAIYCEPSSVAYNCIGRNSQYGIYVGRAINCLTYNCDYGLFTNIGSAVFCESRNNTSGYEQCASVVDSIGSDNTSATTSCRHIHGCVLDSNTSGVNVGSVNVIISNSLITNNTNGINCGSTLAFESRNLYFGNTNKLAGTTANITSYGDSVDSIIDPYTDQTTGDYTPSATSEGLGKAIPIGVLDEATNITYADFGLSPAPVPPAMTCTDINPASGGTGTSVTITGTEFSGSGNIVKFGGSGGTSGTVTAESTTSITVTVPSIAVGDYDIYIENSGGANIVVPNGYEIISTSVPVCAGITNFEILSNNKFYVKCSTATNTPLFLNIYIGTTATPYSGTVSFKVPYSANKELLVTLASNHLSLLVGGTTYYCTVRAENAVGEDTNTAVLSNICSGAEMIQRMNIVTPVVTL